MSRWRPTQEEIVFLLAALMFCGFSLFLPGFLAVENILSLVRSVSILGILGLGRIGREVAALGQAFGMQVLAWGPTLTAERAARAHAVFMELDPLLEEADIVTVQLRLSEQSRRLLTEERLRRIGPGGILINTARGAIVDEQALARVLAEGALGAAGLDVFEEEPLPLNSPLRKLDNVVLTSHIGWPADLTYSTFAQAAVAIVEAYLDGQYAGALNPDALQHRKGP